MFPRIKVKNKKVSNIKEWESAFNDKIRWKQGRSAYLLADFVLNRNGLKEIEKILASCGFRVSKFLSCDVEVSVKFDNNPRCSQRDMVLIGELENMDKIFITIEAKVDEAFGGDTIGNKISSQKSHRAEELLNKFIPCYKEQDKKLLYQLFHATSATIEKGGYGCDFQKSIMLVLVFKAKGFGKDIDYNEKKGQRNYNDFCNFMQAIGASKREQNAIWNFNFEGQEVFFAYSQIEFVR